MSQLQVYLVSTVEIIDPAKPIFVVNGLVDCDEEGEGRRQLYPAA